MTVNQEPKKPYKIFIDIVKKLKEDKLYLSSLIITLLFIGISSYNGVKNVVELYNEDNNIKVNNPNDVDNTSLTTDIDISNYIGIYSKEISLESPIKLNNTCTISSYKYIYQINSNKKITKYLSNECLGTIKIWNDELKETIVKEARYLTANNINYLFANNSMREVGGNNYTKDETLDTIKAAELPKDIEVYFYNDNVVLLSNTNLAIIKNSLVNFELTKDYQNKGGNLEKLVYKVSDKDQFNFIVFSNNEEVNCYESSKEEKPLYTIYQITYDAKNDTFSNPKTLITRDKTTTCNTFDEDLKSISS